MATNPKSAPDQQPSFKDRVKDTLSQGAAYVSSVITGNSNVSSSTIAEDKIIHLIFMGKTGAGKSTFINTFYNLALGTKWDDFPKKFPICTKSQPCNVEQYQAKSKSVENHSEGQFASVTQEPSEYIATGRSFVVKLIDSPGAADTRGIEQDMLNANEIAKFVARAGQFNAICLVLPATANRGTAEEKYLIEQLKTIIPASAYKRIFILVSHASPPSSDVEAYVKSFNLPTENIFYFDNFALSKDGHIDVKNVNLTENHTNHDDAEDDFFAEKINETSNKDSETALKIKATWTKSHQEFGRLIRKAQSLGKHSTNEMEQISTIKSQVTEKIFNAYRHIEALENTEIQVQKAQATLKAYEEEYASSLSNKSAAEKEAALAEAQKITTEALDSYETYTVLEPYSTSYHNTICMNCGVDCHHNCGLDYKGAEYTDHLSGCGCITNGSCHVCPNKCPYTYHRHRYQAYHKVAKKRDNKVVMEQKLNAQKLHKEQKEKLSKKEKELTEKNSKKTSQQASVTDLTACLNKLKAEKIGLQDEIVQLYFELSKVSMSSINFNIGEYYDTLIKNEPDILKRAKLNRDRELYKDLVELYKQNQELLARR